MNNGLYLVTRGPQDIHALEALLALAPDLGYDTLFLQAGGHFQFITHPEVREDACFSLAEIRRLVNISNQRGIRLIPAYNCLGHQSHRQWPHALLRAHPEFNETPDLNMDAFSFDNFYSWCPRHPGIWPLVFDLLDELASAFEADALHLGMDEVFVLGQCPRCKALDAGNLFHESLMHLYGHVVQQRRLKMFIWGDRLLPSSLGYSMWESSHNGTHTALENLPRDIVICDWHYEIMAERQYPSVAYFQAKGFSVWPAGCYHKQAVQQLIEVSVRDATPRMLGYLGTFWWKPSDLVDRLTKRIKPSDPPSELDRAAACVQFGGRYAQEFSRANSSNTQQA